MSSISPATSTTEPPAKRPDRRAIALAVVASASLLVFLWWSAPMPRLDADWMPDGVPVFATPEDMMKSGEDGVLHGASAVRVPSGTRIRLVCAGLGYHGVRIAEGPHRGRFGWTPDQWIAGADGRKLLSDEHLRAGLHRALGIE